MFEKLVWSFDKNERINHLNGCNMTVHRDYKNKACPGEYLYERHGYIAEEVNKILNGKTETTTIPTTQARTYLMKGDKGDAVKLLQENYDIRTARDISGALKDMFKGALQEMMNAEFDESMGYSKIF